MRQVIALGGGGFSMEPENPLLDRYILEQCAKENPKVCFIGTASGDAEGYIERFYNFFRMEECEPTHLSLFKPHTRDIKNFLMEQDILYVGGGNTKNLMTLWREWEIDVAIRQAYEKGTILAGLSAGSLCWFEDGITDSYGAELEPISCLGILRGSHCPHYDGVALHFLDEELHKIVSSREHAKGYRVDKDKESILTTRYLGVK
ncbi:Type 1 glutamine amidotransferase-like domain-containing protein [Paenisporosarcina sp. NPDC076898]|uniref:Type 1 glutamine amidotransferase-like domain-containing protein n=1 Tax=unclassified Paenisporosarcina TaxID=2642018 RepID=UPI003D03F2E1